VFSVQTGADTSPQRRRLHWGESPFSPEPRRGPGTPALRDRARPAVRGAQAQGSAVDGHVLLGDSLVRLRAGRHGPARMLGRRLRPQRLRLQRHHEPGGDPGRPQQHLHPAGPGGQPVRQPAVRHLLRAGTYGSAADPLVFQVGYYTEVAGLGAHAAGHGHRRRHRRVQQPVHGRDQQLQLRRQLLAVAVQPDLNVDLPSTTPAYAPPVWTPTAPAAPTARRSGRPRRPPRSGGPSSTAASSSRTTARRQLRQRRLHRRQPGQRRPRLLRQPAVHGPQQRHRRRERLPAGPVEHGLLRGQGAPAPVFTGQCEQNTVLPRAR
jgi:hypothetical protein